MTKRDYHVSYHFDANGGQGFGSTVITVTTKWWRGYKAKDMHATRKIVADQLRKSLNVGTNKKVNVVLLNITRMPI